MEEKQEETQKRAKSNKGFASFSPEKMRETAARGGRSAHAQKRAHQFTHDEAVAAGKKGGKITADRFKVKQEKREEEEGE